MQTIIWAFGSMVVLLLIIAFLPLGFTFKGKLSIVMASFVLSLGGLAATNTFSLPLTALLLIVLLIITAYILDRRVGHLLYIGHTPLEEEFNDEKENENLLLNLNLEKDPSSYELIELEAVEPKIQAMVDDTNAEIPVSSKQLEIEPVLEQDFEIIDEDISFLLEDDINQQNFNLAVELEHEDVHFSKENLYVDEFNGTIPKNDEGYLSEIESLLDGELEEYIPEGKLDFLEETEDFPPDIVTKQLPESDELAPLDDSTLEFLFATKEVASGLDDSIKINKQVEPMKK